MVVYPTNSRARRAVTLTEVLVVFAILAILSSILIQGVIYAREVSNRTRCLHGFRQLGMAVQGHQAAKGTLPPYSTGFPPGTPYGNWLSHLMPYLEAQESSAADTPPGEPLPFTQVDVGTTGLSFGGANLKFLACSSDPSAGLERYWDKTSHLANWYALTNGQGGYFAPAQPLQVLANSANGLGNIVLFAEGYQVCDKLPRIAQNSIWYHNFGITQDGKPSDDPSYLPNDYTMFQVRPRLEACDNWRTQTPHKVMNVGMADASVRELSGTISPEVWKQLIKPGSGATASE